MILETDRLVLRRLTLDDAPFIHALVNDPDWLRFIGDRNVRTLDDARDYLVRGPLDSYERHGFGLWATALKEGGDVIGMCGLIRRESLPDVDIGFAFLPAWRGRGYAIEAAAGVLGYASGVIGLRRVLAIVTPDNEASVRLLERLGFRFERMVQMPGEAQAIKLLAWDGT